MRKVALLLGGMLIGCALLGVAQETMDLDTALGLYQNAAIMVPYSDAGKAQLEQIIAALETALGVPDTLNQESEDDVGAFLVAAENKHIVNALSQAYYTLADAFLAGESNERETYLMGKAWGFKSLRMNPTFAAIESGEVPEGEPRGFVSAVDAEDDLLALYWAAACWLRAAEFNAIEAVVAGVPEKTDAMSLRCLELDDTYNSYGSYRALGAFWGGLPRMPLGYYRKNFNKSLGYFCKVVDEPTLCAECDDCPDFGAFDASADLYFENRLFFVEYYLIEKGGYWADVKRICEDVLAEPVGETFPLYNAISQEKAQVFLDRALEELGE